MVFNQTLNRLDETENSMANINVMDLIVSGVIAVLWYLLQQKDSKQADEIKLLFDKHDSDVKQLEELKLKIAENHYQKIELDAKFHSLETATRDGFTDLGKKFDRLSDALMAHIVEGKK